MGPWEVIPPPIFAFIVVQCLLWALSPLIMGYKARKRRGHGGLGRETDIYESALGQRQLESMYEKPTKTISVIVPAHNEEDRLPKMLRSTLKYMDDEKKQNSQFSYEVVVVDDGSVDSTADIVLSFAKKTGTNSDLIRLCQFRTNLGKGAAVRQGMLSMRGQYGLMADADDATDIRDLRKLTDSMKLIEKNGMGISIGSRARSDGTAKRPWYRRVPMLMFRAFSSILCTSEIEDTQCGFKLYTRKTTRLLFSGLYLERWAFDTEIIYLATKLGVPLVEVPVRWTEVDGSKLLTGRFSILKIGLTMLRDMCCVLLGYSLGIWQVGNSELKAKEH